MMDSIGALIRTFAKKVHYHAAQVDTSTVKLKNNNVLLALNVVKLVLSTVIIRNLVSQTLTHAALQLSLNAL